MIAVEYKASYNRTVEIDITTQNYLIFDKQNLEGFALFVSNYRD